MKRALLLRLIFASVVRADEGNVSDLDIKTTRIPFAGTAVLKKEAE